MTQISDFKGAPMALFGQKAPTSQYTGTATPPASGVSTDASLATLVGVKWDTTDGRRVTLVQNAGTALVQGFVVQSAAQDTNFAALSPATSLTTNYSSAYPIAATVGGTVIQIANGSGSAITANQFAGGYLTVVTATSAALGLGQTCRIASNTAAAVSTAVVVTLEDPFTVVTDTSARFTLVTNPYGAANGTTVATNGVVICVASGSTQTGVPIGVVLYPIAASSATVPTYGFIQTKGVCAVVGTDSSAVGTLQGISTSAGQVIAYTVGSKLSPVGVAVVAATSGYANLVNLQL
jgi:hypothetical protein